METPRKSIITKLSVRKLESLSVPIKQNALLALMKNELTDQKLRNNNKFTWCFYETKLTLSI